MLNCIKHFFANEDGAVTVDWVVLTSAIVGLAVALLATIGESALDQSTGVGAFLSSQNIATY